MKPLEAYHSLQTVPPAGATVWVSNTGLITGAGTSQYWWNRDYVCPHIVMSGRGRIETDYGAATVSRGDMFCLWPGTAISYGKAPGDTWQVHWVHLMGPGDVDFGKACGFGKTCVRLRPNDPEGVCNRFVEMFRLFQSTGDRNPYGVLRILYGIAEACRGDDPERQPRRKNESTLVVQARRVLDSDLHAGLNVSELAGRLGVSRTTLYLAFQQELGLTPIDYLTQVRIDRAKQVMRSTDYPLAKIAQMTGFLHPKSFLKRFRQREGISPGAWRRLASTEMRSPGAEG